MLISAARTPVSSSPRCSEGRRNRAFGVFYPGYGAGWLIGSVTTGLLNDRSHVALVVFAVVVQLASLPFFILGSRRA
jgi:hypothetical protein